MAQNSSENGESAGGKVKLAILGSSIEPTGSLKHPTKSGYPKHYQGRLLGFILKHIFHLWTSKPQCCMSTCTYTFKSVIAFFIYLRLMY